MVVSTLALLIAFAQLLVLVLAFELSRAETAFAAGAMALAAITGPLTLHALLLPGRRNTALYLRAFRSDGTAAQVRSLIRVALATDYRLCGIRPPTERASWLSRVLLTVATGLKYVGSEYFELEANDGDLRERQREAAITSMEIWLLRLDVKHCLEHPRPTVAAADALGAAVE